MIYSYPKKPLLLEKEFLLYALPVIEKVKAIITVVWIICLEAITLFGMLANLMYYYI